MPSPVSKTKPGPPLSPLQAPMPPISDPMHMREVLNADGTNLGGQCYNFKNIFDEKFGKKLEFFD
jgi:hypothetical protein